MKKFFTILGLLCFSQSAYSATTINWFQNTGTGPQTRISDGGLFQSTWSMQTNSGTVTGTSSVTADPQGIGGFDAGHVAHDSVAEATGGFASFDNGQNFVSDAILGAYGSNAEQFGSKSEQQIF